jgi:hypothetical protein
MNILFLRTTKPLRLPTAGAAGVEKVLLKPVAFAESEAMLNPFKLGLVA